MILDFRHLTPQECIDRLAHACTTINQHMALLRRDVDRIVMQQAREIARQRYAQVLADHNEGR